MICSQCCGSHRQKEIRCPSDCGYLNGDPRFNEERQFEQYLKERYEFRHRLGDRHIQIEKLETHLFVLEYMAYHYYFTKDFSGMNDGEVVDALQYIRGKLSRVALLDRGETPMGKFLWSRLSRELQTGKLHEDFFCTAIDELVPYITEFTGSALMTSDKYIRNLVKELDMKVPELREDLKAEKREEQADREQPRIIIP
jgi:hypothetical protein